MLTRDLMTIDVVSVGPEAKVTEILELLINRRISGVPVVDAEGRVLGIVSEGDLILREKALLPRSRMAVFLEELLADPTSLAERYRKVHGFTARDVMSAPVVTVTEDTPAERVAEVFSKHRINRAPVVRDGRLVGIITRNDLLKALVAAPRGEPAKLTDAQITERIQETLRREPWADVSVIQVTTAGGVVTLTGLVRSEEHKAATEVAARQVPGVRDVVNELVIRAHLGYGA